MDPLRRYPVRPRLRAGLQLAGFKPQRQADLRRRDLHAADPALHRGEYPLLRAGRRDHRQPDAAHFAAVLALRAGDGGGMLSTVLMMPLVNFIGGEDKALGFQGASRCCR